MDFLHRISLGGRASRLAPVVGLLTLVGCAGQSAPSAMAGASMARSTGPMGLQVTPPTPDPRVGLEPGLFDAGETAWNLRLLSSTPPQPEFVGKTNSDLAFTGNYAIQGNYDGVQVWDITNPRRPSSVITYVCPASQSDVSVYDNLLFVSGEGMTGRLDCGTQGVPEAVSHHRLRGIRIFDISDIRNPVNVANVQTCRGSHTHTVVEDPDDDENIYIYVSGSSSVRPEEELPGCSAAMPDEDPNSALFRIEVIRVPLANPQQSGIVSSPRIFEDLVAPEVHGLAPDDIKALEEAEAQGAFVADLGRGRRVLRARQVRPLLDSIVAARGGSGAPTAADSAALRTYLPTYAAELAAARRAAGPGPGPTQCHDITVYPAIGLAGGACGGYGLLLDISDAAHPVRVAAVADSNFAYWHSATFSNDGSSVVFTDEWGGGGAPKCRATDPMEWGANAIFDIDGHDLEFTTYYKMPAPQTPLENCVAHNGSLVPIPGRDIMIQGWYQGGISLFDFTDTHNPVEIAYHDRGPVDATRMRSAGSWSVYWYNGVIVSSEIARGLDIFELLPSEAITQNEIDAAKSVILSQLNSQGQPIFEWPNTFALARAYLDQLERWGGYDAERIEATRAGLSAAEGQSGAARAVALNELANDLNAEAAASGDPDKVRTLARVLSGLSMS